MSVHFLLSFFGANIDISSVSTYASCHFIFTISVFSSSNYILNFRFQMGVVINVMVRMETSSPRIGPLTNRKFTELQLHYPNHHDT